VPKGWRPHWSLVALSLVALSVLATVLVAWKVGGSSPTTRGAPPTPTPTPSPEPSPDPVVTVVPILRPTPSSGSRPRGGFPPADVGPYPGRPDPLILANRGSVVRLEDGAARPRRVREPPARAGGDDRRDVRDPAAPRRR
jgi:hypothetical protein